MLSAFVVWLRGVVLDGTEQGQQRWQSVVEFINAPPPTRRSPTEVDAPNTIAAARMTPAQEAEAFAAYASMT